MNRMSFSMVELVFVIVILGVLASVAVPRLSATRLDSQIAVLRSDLASAMKSIPAKIFAENIDVSQVPSGFNNWGDWIIEISGLDKSRWTKALSPEGISPISPYAKLPCSSTGILRIENGELIFNPGVITITSNQEQFCKAIRDTYPTGSERTIPLTAGSVRF